MAETQHEARQRRLAEALRQNLRRRKAQARGRRDDSNAASAPAAGAAQPRDGDGRDD